MLVSRFYFKGYECDGFKICILCLEDWYFNSIIYRYQDQVLYFFRNLLLSLSKPHKVTHLLLPMWVLLHPLQCILVFHHMVPLSSMDHLFHPMMFHFLGDQHIITTTAAAYLQAAPTDLCICLDQHLILADPWLEMVCFVHLSLCDDSDFFSLLGLWIY